MSLSLENLAALRIQVELEERDDAGKVKDRKLSTPLVIYAANLPPEIVSWLQNTIVLAKD